MLAKLTVTMLKILSLINPSIKYHNMRKIPWNVLVAYWLILLSPWDPRNHATTSVVMTLFLPLGSHLLFLFVHTTKQNLMFIAPGYKNMGGGELPTNYTPTWLQVVQRVHLQLHFYFFIFFPIGLGEEGELLRFWYIAPCHLHLYVCVGQLTPIVTVHLLFVCTHKFCFRCD